MSFAARYAGTCADCGNPIVVGERIRSYARSYAHVVCPVASVPEYDADAAYERYLEDGGPLAEVIAAEDRYEQEREAMDVGLMEMRAARAEREAMDAEYAAGIEDVRRWHENTALFGQAYADAEEYARDMRGLNGDVW